MHQFSVPVVDDLHCAVLLYPQFPHDDVVDAAQWVTPRVRLAVPEIKTQCEKRTNMGERDQRERKSCETYLSSSSVMVPLGSASTLLPQNLSLG